MKYQQVAMLVHLRVEKPQMTKKDDAATRAVNQAFGAAGAGMFRKDLYPKHLIDPICAIEAQAREYVRSQTRNGMLPNRRIMMFLDMMGRYQLAFEQTVTAFLNNWANVLLLAEQQQGGLFNKGEYPDVSNLRGQFIFEYPLTPIGNVQDVVLDELDEAAQSIVISKAKDDERRANEAVVKDAVADLREQVLRIINQTTVFETTNKKGEVVERTKKIYDTLTSDIGDLISLLQDLGAGGNAQLQEVLEVADMHLTLPADALRADLEVCRITKNKAEEILKMMEGFQ